MKYSKDLNVVHPISRNRNWHNSSVLSPTVNTHWRNRPGNLEQRNNINNMTLFIYLKSFFLVQS